jgi:ABC-type spermidine/putrescine transport system permease subunit I
MTILLAFVLESMSESKDKKGMSLKCRVKKNSVLILRNLAKFAHRSYSSLKYYARKHSAFLFLSPVIILLMLLYLLPLILLLAQSFYTYDPNFFLPKPIFTLENYRIVLSPPYSKAITLTLWISATTTILTVILSYPLSFYLVRSKTGLAKKFVMGFLIASFFMQLLIRIYSFYHVFGQEGVLNQTLTFFGLPTQDWLGGPWPIAVSMVHQSIPIAVLVMMGSIKTINPEVEDAAKILGANGVETFFKVTLPLSLPGIIAASLLSFTGSASAYVTPLVLSQGKVLMMANYIYNRFLDVVNYPFAAAMSVVLLILSLSVSYGISGVLNRWVKTE